MSDVSEPSGDRVVDYRGYFDRFEDGCARGWVTGDAEDGSPVPLEVLIDGDVVDQIDADVPREDVRASLQLTHDRVGFSWDVPNAFLDGRLHRVGFRLPDGRPLPSMPHGDPSRLSDGVEFSLLPTVTVQGHVDGYVQGALRGWVIRRRGRLDKGTGGVAVAILCEGLRIGLVKADRLRLDVAGALDVEPHCGFEFVVPNRFRRSYRQTFRFLVPPDNVELENSPLRTGVVDDALEGKLLDMAVRVDRLHRDMLRDVTALRREMMDLLPAPRHTVEDYDRWARRYLESLRRRVDAARADAARPGGTDAAPLVSVLMPTYRPRIDDFIAAIESVLAQTWQNWELVIVDDGGKSPPITRCMQDYAKRDARIRTIKRARNAGIAGATNAALEAARGDWIAFFDHDDLLVDVALEVMMGEARRSGARMLYSDEDKIDAAGHFSEPNFKPDWNHRYVLGCNYVCHFLVVSAETARAVGPLRSECDGAQDHDYILRVFEAVGEAGIRHVPEMLYHWRKTPGSTATDISNKGYAVNAGVGAVSAHLGRIGRDATVAAIDNLTIYSVLFRLGRTPRVAVIVPYRDEIPATRRAVERLLATTDYPAFTVVLVDNWSTGREAKSFRDGMSADPRVRVLVVEEEFNFAALNNRAAAAVPDAEFLVFMNNDVFVTERDWLSRMLGEMSDPGIAAVGAKLLYPDGSVQHAGVIVGAHGVAAHMHLGIGARDYGYVGRARLAQELTAVTAALMLVRADAFHAVGGFDAVHLAVAYNDVDLCLKLRDAGWRIVFSAETVAEHHESLSRGSDQRPDQESRFFAEQQHMLARWQDHPLFRADPAYNPWLTRDDRLFFDLLEPTAPAIARERAG